MQLASNESTDINVDVVDLWHRNGEHCTGATEFLACPFHSHITLRTAKMMRTFRRNNAGFYYQIYMMPMSCAACSALRSAISGLFCYDVWKKRSRLASTHNLCSKTTCNSSTFHGTDLCEDHAIEVSMTFGLPSLNTFPTAVRRVMKRPSWLNIRTPDDAATFLMDPTRQFEGLGEQELVFLAHLRDGGPAFFTDTEFVPGIDMLLQVALVDSKREVCFSNYIHHNCVAVADIWHLAVEKNGKSLNHVQAAALRKAFGEPTQNKPRGNDINWLVERWDSLKQQYPDLMVAEWSWVGCDERLYRSTLADAGFDPQTILPSPSRWIRALSCWRDSLRGLCGLNLAYVCSLFAPSNLVWEWHDAVADALMLHDLTLIRERKIRNGTTVAPQPPESVLKVFSRSATRLDRPTMSDRMLYQGSITSQGQQKCFWTLEEERRCFSLIAAEHDKAQTCSMRSLLLRSSLRLAEKAGSHRTVSSIWSRWYWRVRRVRFDLQFVESSNAGDDNAKMMAELLERVNRENANRLLTSSCEIKEAVLGSSEQMDEAQRIVRCTISELCDILRHLGYGADSVFLKPNFWAECRRRAVKEIQMNHELSIPNVDLAIMSERQILTGQCVTAGCGNIKSLTGKFCPSCANRRTNKTCATAGCKKRSGQKTYCNSCYDRQANKMCATTGCGKTTGSRTYCPSCRYLRANKTCATQGCGKNSRTRKQCSSCTYRLANKTCATEGCRNKTGSLYCATCSRKRRAGKFGNGICSTVGCGNRMRGGIYCDSCRKLHKDEKALQSA